MHSCLPRSAQRCYFSILLLMTCLSMTVSGMAQDGANQWIRINQLGYSEDGIKVAVWVTKENTAPDNFQLIDADKNAVVFANSCGSRFGKYGPFTESLRLDFTSFHSPGRYYLKCGTATSPVFPLGNQVYQGAADIALHYMRQQRSGFNPFLKDSCHTHDGYTMYGPMPDTTRINVWGGWHDATDYLQYVTTSANATFHLLAAYRDFPGVFADQYAGNGLAGGNGKADVLDEATWGLDWLLKMHPRKDWMFNQLADDRDHHGFRLPNKDSVDYGIGAGLGRPVYFATGKPQGLGNYKNQSDGVASTAGKFASAFALGALVYDGSDPAFSRLLRERSLSAYDLGIQKPGVCQTAPNREPYYYEEANWVDDMELGSAMLFQLTGDKKYLQQSIRFSEQEKVTPWMGADTARHYQWYPFHNFGHYENALKTSGKEREVLIGYYKEGIERVWKKAQKNAFYRGVPFIWCSNNLTVSFAIQCYLYRQLSHDRQFAALEQACYDWLLGCNPWGTSMIYGLPANGVSPHDPHSSLSVLDHYPLTGGLVDGPVYGSIYRRLRGLRLLHEDAYAEFQSDYIVYHDDAGDYSTNEPTMDGTASLVYLLAAREAEAASHKDEKRIYSHGAIVRGDTMQKKIALVFTGDEFNDGGDYIATALQRYHVRASFFLTGNFYRNPRFTPTIKTLKQNGNYLGTHSDKHLLYCDWNKRDSLLVTRDSFDADINHAFSAMSSAGMDKKNAHYFLPPYEWYNDSIAAWTKDLGLQLINFSPGTRSNADYTYPQMGAAYVASDSVMRSVMRLEESGKRKLNGFILLSHIGTDPRRKDKFYRHLPELITTLQRRGYAFVRIDELLQTDRH